MITPITHADIIHLYKTEYAKSTYPFIQDTTSRDYHASEWVKIKLKPHNHPNLQNFVIAINEIFRYEIGSTQPEYRFSETRLLSKRVYQSDDVDPHQIRTLYYYWKEFITNPHLYWEGMGRVIFSKYIYQENDFNLYSAIIDKNNYFIGLDTEASLWPITEKYHFRPNNKFSDAKILINNNSSYPTYKTSTPNGKTFYVISGKKRNFIGELHHEDYENLPRLNHLHPSNWFLLSPELKMYAKSLSRNKRFVSEKYFSTLKFLITDCMKQLLIDLHLPDENDRRDARDLISTQIQKLTTICKHSTAFMSYLQKNYLPAIQVILYETKLFLQHNKAYVLKDKELQLQIHDYIYKCIIQQAETVIQTLNHPLTADELSVLTDFSNKLLGDSMETSRLAHEFYQSQGMDYHANLANT